MDHSVSPFPPFLNRCAQVRKIHGQNGLRNRLRPLPDQLPEAALLNLRVGVDFAGTDKESNKPVANYAFFEGNGLQVEAVDPCLSDSNPSLAIAEVFVSISIRDSHGVKLSSPLNSRAIHFRYLDRFSRTRQRGKHEGAPLRSFRSPF